jgi:hypothetical protein
LVKLYDRKNALVAADMLNDRVLPFFEEQGVPLLRIHRPAFPQSERLALVATAKAPEPAGGRTVVGSPVVLFKRVVGVYARLSSTHVCSWSVSPQPAQRRPVLTSLGVRPSSAAVCRNSFPSSAKPSPRWLVPEPD